MSKFIDYYKVLGLDRSASIVDIRKAYRKLAIELHPDKNSAPDAKEAFVRISEAFTVLKSISTKVCYDKLYDHYVLNLTLATSSNFNRYESSRTERVHKQAQRGRSKAQTNAQRPKKKFKKKTERSSFWDGLATVLEFIGTLFMLGG